MVTMAAEGVDLFIPKVYDIVWSLIILLIVAAFFYKFFLPKFQSIFDERAAKIEGGIAKAEQAQKDADEAKKKYQAQLSTARVEASRSATMRALRRRTSSPTRVRAPRPRPRRSRRTPSVRWNLSSRRPW